MKPKKKVDKIMMTVYVWGILNPRRTLRMRRTNIYLGDVQHKKLKAMGKKMGLKVSEIIRRMVDEGLKKYEKKERG